MRTSKEFRRFSRKLWLSSLFMYPDSIRYVVEVYETNQMSTVGTNINEIEKMVCRKVSCKYALALSFGTVALHMAVKLAGVSLQQRVFCRDMAFGVIMKLVLYECGVFMFIDTEYDMWNMLLKA